MTIEVDGGLWNENIRELQEALNSLTSFRIGAAVGNARTLDGALAHAFLIEGELSSGEKADLLAFLDAQMGIL